MASERGERPVWAKWRVDSDGGVQVVATYKTDDGFDQSELSYESLEMAAGDLGDSFREVVEKVMAEGGRAGRWRP